MNRVVMSSKLALINPCLGKQDFVEVLGHICFKDGNAITFNGAQAASIKIDSGLDCTVPGQLLQKLVNSYSAEDVILEQEEDKLLVKSGKSVVALNHLSSDDYVFELDSIEDCDVQVAVNSDFVNGLSKCLVSVSDNFIEKSQSGVTLDAHKGGVFMYSTDDVCLSKYTTEQTSAKGAKIILPKLFCNQVIRWYNSLGDAVLHVGFDYVKAVYSDGEAIIFSKVDTAIDFLDFDDVIAQSYYEDTKVVEVPEKLKEVIQRCQLMTSGALEQCATIEVTGDLISIVAESKNGVHNVADEINIDGVEGDYSFIMDCNLLGRGLDCVDRMTFSAENPAELATTLFIGESENFLHLINSK